MSNQETKKAIFPKWPQTTDLTIVIVILIVSAIIGKILELIGVIDVDNARSLYLGFATGTLMAAFGITPFRMKLLPYIIYLFLIATSFWIISRYLG